MQLESALFWGFGHIPLLVWCKCHYVAQGRAHQPMCTEGMSPIPAERTGHQDSTYELWMTFTMIKSCIITESQPILVSIFN